VDWRIGHAGDNHLTADKAAHPLAYSESWRSVFAEQLEAFSVFHRGDTLAAIKSL